MISKNFIWWLISVMFMVGLIINTIYENWIISLLLTCVLVFTLNKYFIYRKRGE